MAVTTQVPSVSTSRQTTRTALTINFLGCRHKSAPEGAATTFVIRTLSARCVYGKAQQVFSWIKVVEPNLRMHGTGRISIAVLVHHLVKAHAAVLICTTFRDSELSFRITSAPMAACLPKHPLAQQASPVIDGFVGWVGTGFNLSG